MYILTELFYFFSTNAMRDNDTHAMREMFQYSSLVKKRLDRREIVTHWRAFLILDKQ